MLFLHAEFVDDYDRDRVPDRDRDRYSDRLIYILVAQIVFLSLLDKH